MSNKYERTFTVAVPVARAWRAFTDPAELAAWFTPRTAATDARPGDSLDFGFEGMPNFNIEMLEVEPERLLHYKWGPGVTPGSTDVSIAFEATGEGTRITITQSGFGESDEWLDALQGITMGLSESIADLILYLETGLAHPRHYPSRSVLGVGVHDAPAGPKVYHVGAGTFAEQAGLRPGDLLLELAGVPAYGRRDVAVITRTYAPGDVLEVAWARDGQLMRGSAALTDRGSLFATERGPLRWT